MAVSERFPVPLAGQLFGMGPVLGFQRRELDLEQGLECGHLATYSRRLSVSACGASGAATVGSAVTYMALGAGAAYCGRDPPLSSTEPDQRGGEKLTACCQAPCDQNHCRTVAVVTDAGPDLP